MEKEISQKDYLKSAIYNLKRVSRTANGILDTSASKNKFKIVIDIRTKVRAKIAQNNFKSMIIYAYKNKDKKLKNELELRKFVETIAININQGIINKEVLYRTEDSNKFAYTPINLLPQRLNQFYSELLSKLNYGSQDPKTLAAWAIYRIDPIDHFFADGCSKISLVISSWILMRFNCPLPVYTNREDYYNHVPKTKTIKSAFDEKQFKSWSNYYFSLFKSQIK